MRDEPDFDDFYAGTFRRVVGQVFAMTGDLAEAEDAVQEAYARGRPGRGEGTGPCGEGPAWPHSRWG